MTERDLEMMDDYLSNRLNAEQKSAFEQQVQADPQLAQELNIQQGLVEGLKQARVVELKSMLNNIPVSPVSGGSSLLTKVGTWAVVAGLVVTGIYFFYSKEEETASGTKQIAEQTPEVQPETEEVPETQPEVTPEKQEETTSPVTKTDKKKTTAEVNPEVTEAKPTKPDVFVPSQEADEETREFERAEMENIKKAFVTSSIVVETDTMSKKYNFHYVFRDSKLILYGAFEQNVYEILEFIGDEKRTVVLFYKSSYYLLDIAKVEPTKLSPIRDQKLLKMLKAHRSK
jgi:hypothetical protein